MYKNKKLKNFEVTFFRNLCFFSIIQSWYSNLYNFKFIFFFNILKTDDCNSLHDYETAKLYVIYLYHTMDLNILGTGSVNV